MTQTHTAEPYVGFERVAELRRDVVTLIHRQVDLVRDISNEAQQERWSNRLGELAAIVEADSFKVLILGQFSRGKSTVINALLGQKILPTHALETTAIINAVRFGEEKQAVVYPRPTPNDPHPAPIQVSVEALEDYVRVRRNAEDRRALNPYVRADVFWPIDLCRNGVELIDSPGLDAMNEAREEETIAYLSQVDAVVIVLDAQQVATRSEINFFKDIVLPLGHEDVFWVVNKINLVQVAERDDVVRETWRDLGSYVRRENRIFFIDAAGALEAKQAGDALGVRASGLPQLEANLEKFLTLHRGRAKVLVPVRQVQQSIREVRDAIRAGEQLLHETLESLVDRAHRAEQPLARMEQTAKYLSERIDSQFAELSQQAGRDAERYFTGLIKRVPKLMEGLKAQSTVSLSPGRFRSSTEALATELSHALRKAVQHDVLRWRDEELSALVKSRLEAIQHGIRDDVRDFEESLKALRLNLAAPLTADVQPGAGFADVDLVAAVAGGARGDLARFGAARAVGGVLAGGAGVAAAAVGMGILGGVFGVTLAAPPVALILAGLWALAAAMPSTAPQKVVENKVRGRIVDPTVGQLTEQKATLVRQVESEVESYLSTISVEFGSVLTSRISSLKQELAAALDAKHHGGAAVRARREELARRLTELDEIGTALEAIVDKVVALDHDTGDVLDAADGRDPTAVPDR